MKYYDLNNNELLKIYNDELEAIFNDVYGITIKFQFVELLKMLEDAGYVLCKAETDEHDLDAVIDFNKNYKS